MKEYHLATVRVASKPGAIYPVSLGSGGSTDTTTVPIDIPKDFDLFAVRGEEYPHERFGRVIDVVLVRSLSEEE